MTDEEWDSAYQALPRLAIPGRTEARKWAGFTQWKVGGEWLTPLPFADNVFPVCVLFREVPKTLLDVIETLDWEVECREHLIGELGAAVGRR